MQSIWSNSIDYLFERLLDDLFEEEDLFQKKRIVFVETKKLAVELSEKIAKRCSVFFGVSILPLDKLFTPLQLKEYDLNFFELFFTILNLLEKETFAPLCKQEEKKALAAETLAKEFIKVGSYGKNCLSAFQSGKGGLVGDLFLEAFTRLKKKTILEISSAQVPKNVSIYLFALTHMPEALFTYFCKASKTTKVRHYLLNYSALYFSQEVKRKRESLLEEVLFDHPFLSDYAAPLGKMINLSLDYGEERDEVFYLSSQTNDEALQGLPSFLIQEDSPPTWLSYLKEDVLKNSIEARECEEDKSIQIFQAKEPSLEASIAFDLVKEALLSGFQPDEIQILSPKIERYLPFLRKVFKTDQEKIPLRFFYETAQKKDLLSFGMKQLLELAGSRFEPIKVLDFLDHRSVKEKWGLKDDDLSWLKGKFEQSGASFGYSTSQRRKIAKKHLGDASLEEDEHLTMEHVFKKLLKETIYYEHEDTKSANSIDSSQFQTLGRLSNLCETLAEKLDLLYPGNEKTLDEWGALLCEFLNLFFKEDEEFYPLEKKIVSTLKGGEHLFCFERIKKQLISLLDQETKAYVKGAMNGIHVASLQQGCQSFCKMTILLGMSDDVFPKREVKWEAFQDLLQGDYSLSQGEKERLAILEALLTTKERVALTYPITNEKNESVAESFVLASFEELLKKMGKGLIKKIAPSKPYDLSLFEEGTGCRGQSLHAFHLARAQLEKKERLYCDPAPLFPKVSSSLEKRILSQKEIKQALLNPLSHSLKRFLGIHFRSKKQLMSGNEERAYFKKYELKDFKMGSDEEIEKVVKEKRRKQSISLTSFAKAQIQQKKKGVVFEKTNRTLTFGFTAKDRFLPLFFEVEGKKVVVKGSVDEIVPPRSFNEEFLNLEEGLDFLLFLCLIEREKQPEGVEWARLIKGTIFENPKNLLQAIIRFLLFLDGSICPFGFEAMRSIKKNQGVQVCFDELDVFFFGFSSEAIEDSAREWNECLSPFFSLLVKKESS